MNPPAGYFVNANNDPAGVTLGNNPLGSQRPGGGIFYLAYNFDGGFRAGRIGERIREYLNSGDHHLSFDEMQSIQADVKQRDSQVLLPYLKDAWENAKREGAPPQLAALAADPRLAEAMRRLSAWSLDTPTGIPEGYDAADVDGALSVPTVLAEAAYYRFVFWHGMQAPPARPLVTQHALSSPDRRPPFHQKHHPPSGPPGGSNQIGASEILSF